jgi:hypothetical protein
MDFLSAFLVGLISTVVVGGVARLIAGSFTVHSLPGTAGFCIALGYVFGKFGQGGPLSRETALALTSFGGAALALLLIWFLLVRKSGTRV